MLRGVSVPLSALMLAVMLLPARALADETLINNLTTGEVRPADLPSAFHRRFGPRVYQTNPDLMTIPGQPIECFATLLQNGWKEGIIQAYYDDRQGHHILTQCLVQLTGVAAAHQLYGYVRRSMVAINRNPHTIRGTDEAVVGVWKTSATYVETVLVLRRANVVIEVRSDAGGKPLLSLGQVERLATTIARRLR